MSSTLENDPRVIKQQVGLAGLLADTRRRIRQGDIGQLPVIIGLIVIWAIFYVASDGIFLKPFNLVNLTLQMASVGSISVGIVLVLLLGEIDLSAGIVSGMCAAVMAVLSVNMGVSAPLAVGMSLVLGFTVGAIHGVWATRFGVPSFVVTLAGSMIWQGVLLQVLGRTGTINLRDPFIIGLTGIFFKGFWAWALAAAFLFYVAAVPVLDQRKRKAVGLTSTPMTVVLIRAGVVTASVAAAVWVLSSDRGVSLGLVFLVALVVVMDFVLRRTRFGRMIYAIGGNAEAARRAGMPVKRVRVLVFALASMMAAWGGLLGASRLWAVNQSAGTGGILLNAIAAAVIGGTSLLGGRGSVWAALLGIIVIQSISNGMDLLSLPSPIKLIVTGAVLLTAVTLDAVLRQGKQPAR
jgi:D-xylose transport system permease protein